jgi:hypothetical protein
MVSSQLRALDAVLLRTQDTERRLLQERLDEMSLALERARMAAEDARCSMIPHNHTGWRTWREFALGVNAHVDSLHADVIQPALDLVEEAAAQLASDRPGMAYDTLQDARRVLVQESDEEDGEDSEEAEDGEESE